MAWLQAAAHAVAKVYALDPAQKEALEELVQVRSLPYCILVKLDYPQPSRHLPPLLPAIHRIFYLSFTGQIGPLVKIYLWSN